MAFACKIQVLKNQDAMASNILKEKLAKKSASVFILERFPAKHKRSIYDETSVMVPSGMADLALAGKLCGK
jgi:hypothetical protein